MRMAELSRQSGVPRETIHYYLREGLLPEPLRTGRTRATYDERHLERLRLIRHLREERFLPIAVIRSMVQVGLEGGDIDTGALSALARMTPASAGSEPIERDVVELARERGLLGAEFDAAALDGASGRDLLVAVRQAAELDPEARELSLADMAACAPVVARMVREEAAVFFQRALASGRLADTIGALARSRLAVQRYLVSYRSLSMQQVVQQLLDAMQEARQPKVELLPPGGGGTGDACPRAGDAHGWVWRQMMTGREARIRELSPEQCGRLSASTRALVDLIFGGALEVPVLERFALGRLRLAEGELAKALSSSEDGKLERVVNALGAVLSVDPSNDADPARVALASLRRGLLLVRLPESLGLRPRAQADLRNVVAALGAAPGKVEAESALCMEGNARLALAREAAAANQTHAALRILESGVALEDDGPLGAATRALHESLRLTSTQDSWPGG